MTTIIRRFALGVGLAAGIAALSVPATMAAEIYTIRFSADSPPTNIKVQGQMMWADLAKKASDGRLEIKIFPNAQLYNDLNAIPAVSAGTIDAAAPPSALLTSVVPASAIFELPSIWGVTYDQYRELLSGPFGQALEAQYEEKLGVKIIGYYNVGSWIWASTATALMEPTDFEGQKLRIIGNPMIEQAFIALGAVPTQVAWPEVPTALSQGVIDGLETTLSGFTSIKGWELARHLTFANHKVLPYVFIMNEATWDKLPADLQQVMLETFEESRIWHDTQLEAMNEEMLASFRDNGTEVHIPTQEQLHAIGAVAAEAEQSYLEEAGLEAEAELARESVGN